MNKSLNILLFVLTTSFLLLASPVNAQILDKTYNRKFTATNEYIQISETKQFTINQSNYYIADGSLESFTIFFPIKNDPFREQKQQQTLDSIVISDSLGNHLNFEVLEENSGSLIIGVRFPIQITYSTNYSITLSYNAYGLLVKTGAIRDVYIPAFAENYEFSNEQFSEIVTTTVSIPRSLGEVNFVTVPHIKNVNENETVITIQSNDLIGTPAWIQVGTTQYYEFSLAQPYSKTSVLPLYLNTYALPIPRDVASGPIEQTVLFKQFNPQPAKVYTDENDNLIAEFKIPSNQSGEITVSGYIEINQTPDYSTSWGTKSDIKQDIIEQATKPGEY